MPDEGRPLGQADKLDSRRMEAPNWYASKPISAVALLSASCSKVAWQESLRLRHGRYSLLRHTPTQQLQQGFVWEVYLRYEHFNCCAPVSSIHYRFETDPQRKQ